MAQRKRAQDPKLEALLRELERQHPDCVTGGGNHHFKVRCPDGRTLVSVASKPGKHNRATQNATGALRRGGFEL